ncbi:MAG: lecithin retinol acyltransferase family protein [Synechococcales cyanobacterium SupBloom_Metag_052]|nr:lecithin retinol acyltransferase family protein [Synechococcales cyanobacterium SupBloom_Metag_052]
MASADHLKVPRQHGLFVHHGIDLGDGTVAHYLEGRQILRSPLQDFSLGQPVSTVPYPPGSCSPPGVSVHRALGRLGEQRYNLIFNNCEHFAHWCKTGRHRSAQVEGWLQTGSLGALALGQMVPAALLAGVRLLLRQDLRLDGLPIGQGRELALRSLEQLEGLRLRLQQALEQELTKAESRWGQGSPTRSGTGAQGFEGLRLAAQRLEDKLSEVEELQQRLDQLVKGHEV